MYILSIMYKHFVRYLQCCGNRRLCLPRRYEALPVLRNTQCNAHVKRIIELMSSSLKDQVLGLLNQLLTSPKTKQIIHSFKLFHTELTKFVSVSQPHIKNCYTDRKTSSWPVTQYEKLFTWDSATERCVKCHYKQATLRQISWF